MKKFFYVMMSAAMLCMLSACGPQNDPDPKPDDDDTPEYLDKTKQSSMVVTLGAVALAGDTKIEVTEAEPSLSGAVQMGVSGMISGVKAFRVTATRSEADQKDELCAGVQCVPGDGELTQDFDYNLMGNTEASWYTHYTPVKNGVYTVKYCFQNYNRSLTVTVKYNYTAE